MIEWKPIETEFNLIGSNRIYTDGRCINDRPHLLPRPATHWAHINLPVPPVRSCDTCNPGAMKLACCGCKNHSKWEAAT